MNFHWLMRLKLLFTRPLSRKRLYVLLVVLGFCVVVVVIEKLAGGWPEALTPDFRGRGSRLPQWPN